MEDLNIKDTNELENILTDELVGPNPGLLMNRDDEHGSLRDKVNRFFHYMSESKRLKEEFHGKILHSWGMMDDPDKPRWLDYYKSYLIKEIRNEKLKKLIK